MCLLAHSSFLHSCCSRFLCTSPLLVETLSNLGQKAKEVASNVKEGVSEKAQGLAGWVSETSHDFGQKATEQASRAKETAYGAWETVQQKYHDIGQKVSDLT